VNFFDTAEGYGPYYNEELVGEAAQINKIRRDLSIFIQSRNRMKVYRSVLSHLLLVLLFNIGLAQDHPLKLHRIPPPSLIQTFTRCTRS
jgi:hypothetical protein